jgi:predicted DNA-binding transcriptional regulator YafY
MRADRLLAILMALQVHQRLTARELAEQLEVSERTIYRDMEALAVAGVPVLAERGLGGGWSLLEEYRSQLSGLNLAEAEALLMSQPQQVLADLGLETAAKTATIKALAGLTSTARRSAEYANQRIYVDVGGWRQSPDDVTWLPLLQLAVWQDQRVQIRYERNDSQLVERVLDPLGLVAKGSLWYLVAASEQNVRTYRISRIRDAQLLPDSAQRPEDFDLQAYWQSSTQEFRAALPQYEIVLRAPARLLPRLRSEGRYAHVVDVEPLDQPEWLQVRLNLQSKENAVAFVLSFGTQVTLLWPEDLRQAVRDLATQVLEHYAD